MRKASMPLLLATLFAAALINCEKNTSNPIEEQQKTPRADYHCADTIEMHSPGGGDIYTVGDILEVRLCADTNHQILIAISFDEDELYWYNLADCFPFTPLDTSVKSPQPGVVRWPIPPLVIDPEHGDTTITVSEHCRVVAHRVDKIEYKTLSNGRFYIHEKE